MNDPTPTTEAGAASSPGSSSRDWAALGQRWWAHIEYLASDALEGRDTGSTGYDKAADYVAEQFRAVGLQPAGVDGFRQRMGFNVTRIDEPHSSFELVQNGQVRPVVLGEDAMLGVTSGSREQAEGASVFVGYGLTVPDLGYSDMGDVDLRGKIAVFVTGGPSEIPGAVKAHFESVEERRKAFNAAGALGAAVIPNPKALEIPWSRMAKFRFEPRMELEDPGRDVPPQLAFSALFNTERAELVFTGSGHSWAELLPLIQDGKPLPHFPLAWTFRARVAVRREKVTSQNVVGVLPGSDPERRHEFVALTAHLDHVGVGEPVNGDRIYSGAMDNASGVASLIEVARAIIGSGHRPKRSLLFLAVTGEEKGLLGSQYYATHPTVTGRIVADLNMDMYNPLFPLRFLEIQGLGESSLGRDIQAVAGAAGVTVQPDQKPERNLFIRSDQYSFIKQGVPALAFKFSFVPGTPEEKLYVEWLTTRYHAPLDDLEQPVDRPAAAQFNALLEALTLRVANADQRPEWNADSFFRRFAK